MSAPGQLRPVPRRSTAELIADQLRAAIMYGSLSPGDQLGEADLAGRLGVSRGPLREAMQRLVQEGLLRSERHRGLFVRELTPDDVRDVYVARLAVERTACELIMRGNRGEAVARLTPALDRLARAAAAADRHAMSEADQEFHETLVSCSGNSRLERMARTLLVETRMCLTVMQDPGRDRRGRGEPAARPDRDPHARHRRPDQRRDDRRGDARGRDLGLTRIDEPDGPRPRSVAVGARLRAL